MSGYCREYRQTASERFSTPSKTSHPGHDIRSAAGNQAMQRSGGEKSLLDRGIDAVEQFGTDVANMARVGTTLSGSLGANIVQAARWSTKCGAAISKTQWTVPAGSNGWIIQHVTFEAAIQDKDGNGVVANNTPEEYWEAWKVQNGNVFVGESNSAHQYDMFLLQSEGEGKKGRLTERGRAKFVSGYTLQSPPWGRLPASRDLPAMRTAPDGWFDAGALDHHLIVDFDCTVDPHPMPTIDGNP